MRNIIAIAIISAVLLAAPAPAAHSKAVADFATIVSILSSNYDEGKYNGIYGFTVYGVKSGKVKVVFESADGQKLSENIYVCEPGGYDGHVSCYIDTDKSPKPAPFAVKTGTYRMKLYDGATEIYSFEYKLTVIVDYGYKSVYMTGDWVNVATISTGDIATVSVFNGSPEACKAGGISDPQVMLYRGGEYVGKGHISGNMSPNCSAYEQYFYLFKEDENHFTGWVKASDILSTDGTYELKLFDNKKLVRTYSFTVSGGSLTSAPSAANPVQAALQPGVINVPDLSKALYYAK